MSHISLGELRNRMQAVLQDAKAHGYSTMEVIPPEMQDSFQGVAALKTAKTYIKDADEREKDLRTEVADLKQALVLEKKKAESFTPEIAQLQIELKNAQSQAQMYLNVMLHSEERLETYEKRLKAATEAQSVAEEQASNCPECERLRHIVVKVFEENKEFLDLKEESDRNQATSETLQGLVDLLEEDNADSTKRHYKGNSAAVSEARILRNYYHLSSSILVSYKDTIQTLLEPFRSNKARFAPPKNLKQLLASAKKECEAFDVVHEAMEMEEELESDPVREQLVQMANSAKTIQGVLGEIGDGITKYFEHLDTDTKSIRGFPDLFKKM